MKPIKFREHNTVYAEHQEEYEPLPSYKTEDGTVISCWKLTWRERLTVLFTGKVWCFVETFNRPLQPMLLDTKNPFRPRRHGENE